MAYESRREVFEKIAKKYHDYVKLYKMVTGGSTEGITPFDEFYWRFTYYQKYEETIRLGNGGH